MGQLVGGADLPVDPRHILGAQRPEVSVRDTLPAAGKLEDALRHPGPEGVDRVCVAEAVRVEVGDSGPFAETPQHGLQPIGPHPGAVVVHP